MSEAPERIWAQQYRNNPNAGHWLATAMLSRAIPYRRADTVVDRGVAEKMAAALRRAQNDLTTEAETYAVSGMAEDARRLHAAIQHTQIALDAHKAALAAYEEATK